MKTKKEEAMIKAHSEYQSKVFGDFDDLGRPLLKTNPDREDIHMFNAGMEFALSQFAKCEKTVSHIVEEEVQS